MSSTGYVYEDNDDPTWADVIIAFIQNNQRSSFTALPASIVTYDPVRRCATCQPNVLALDGKGLPKPLPTLPCMPVMHFAAGGAGGFAQTVDNLLPGDGVLVLFSSVAMAQWLTSGSPAALPESPRRQSLSDGIVIAGLKSFIEPLPLSLIPGIQFGKADGTSRVGVDLAGVVTIQAGATTVTVSPAGAVNIIAAPGGVTIGAGLNHVVSGELMFAELVKIASGIAAAGGSYALPGAVPLPPGDPVTGVPAISVTQIKSD